jgi:hypothetical protein
MACAINFMSTGIPRLIKHLASLQIIHIHSILVRWKIVYPIYRNFIWALRGALNLSWGTQKIIYYAGGVDNDLFPKFMTPTNLIPDY